MVYRRPGSKISSFGQPLIRPNVYAWNLGSKKQPSEEQGVFGGEIVCYGAAPKTKTLRQMNSHDFCIFLKYSSIYRCLYQKCAIWIGLHIYLGRVESRQ